MPPELRNAHQENDKVVMDAMNSRNQNSLRQMQINISRKNTIIDRVTNIVTKVLCP